MTYQKLRELDRVTKEQLKSKYYYGLSKDVRSQAAYHPVGFPEWMNITKARDTSVTCTGCWGKGMILSDNGVYVTWGKCPTCGGTKILNHFNADSKAGE